MPAKGVWWNDFGILVDELTALAPDTSGQLMLSGISAQKYTNRKITWNLVFKEVIPKGDTATLLFDLEPFGIKPGNPSGRPSVVFRAAAGSLDDWKAVAPGDRVNIAGVVGNVSFMTMGDSSGSVRFATVLVNAVVRIRE